MSNRNLKVLHVTRSIDPVGGCEIYIRALLTEQTKKGWQPFLCLALQPSQPNNLWQSTTHVIPELASLEHRRARGSLTEFSKTLLKIQPDVIHIHDLNNPYIIEHCGRRFPTIKTTLNADAFCGGTDKYLYTSQKNCGFPLSQRCLAIAYYERCMSRHPRRAIEIISIKKKALQATRFISRLVVPSESSRKIMLQNGVDPSCISVIPLFAHFQPSLPIHPYPRNSAHILFLGRLRPYKGVSYLLKALALMKFKSQLRIVGSGEERGQLEKMSSLLKIADRVRFLGNLPHHNVIAEIDRASLIATPSIYPDSFPTVGLEAMSRARPVVGFQMGGIPEWLLDGETGYLAAPQNATDLAERMDSLLADPEKAENFGKMGRQVFEERFSADVHLRHISKLYEDATKSFSNVKTSAR